MEKYILEAVDVLGKAIVNCVEDKALMFDVTYEGVVVQNFGNGLYLIRMNGSEYKVKSETGRTTLKVRDIVKVVAPQNDFDKLFIY